MRYHAKDQNDSSKNVPATTRQSFAIFRIFGLYARYKASLQRLIYRMSVAGQRQKIYVRIQSNGTARNLYTFFTLEPKNHFR